MNKKYLVPLLLSGMILTSINIKNAFNPTYADDVISLDTTNIIALSHKGGEVVNFVNDDIANYWDNDASDITLLKSLYEVNTDMTSFFDYSYDHEYVRDLYARWDDFKPVNNVITWKSNVLVNNYDIVISLNPQLTEVLYEEKGLTESNYKMDNPYANTHYYWQVTAHTDSGDIKSQIFDFVSGSYKRTVDIPTISNTRDIGGFTGKYGEMKQGLIYRSGRLDDSDISAQDALSKLGIQTDLDLRNNGEGLKNPANLNKYYLRTLQSYYNDFKEENRTATIEAVRIFADKDNYPVIFHCAIGRDRTGTLAMLLQALCGASKEYIIHDYFTSMWSVTGTYQKTVEDLNLSLVKQTLEALENYGGDINSGVENFLKEDSNHIGLTEQEIQNIRDIWSGIIEVEHAPKTHKAKNNYENRAYVQIKAIGHTDLAMMVTKGTKISAPYELDNSLSWFRSGESFDFNNQINDDSYIYADYIAQYVVTIHFVGIAKADEIYRLNRNESISLDKYALEGFEMIVISDEGREITNYSASRDTYINILYIRK